MLAAPFTGRSYSPTALASGDMGTPDPLTLVTYARPAFRGGLQNVHPLRERTLRITPAALRHSGPPGVHLPAARLSYAGTIRACCTGASCPVVCLSD